MNRARALTLQLLTFAKGGVPVLKATTLPAFIREAVHFALSGSNIACQFSLPEDLWSCNIDKNQIGQVFDNIVINAQQAMPNGGMIEVAACNFSAGADDLPLLNRGNYVKVSIRDFGIGISKEIMPRIFDPFYTTKTKGHGLGLATCHSILNRHGGCITAESELGKGSLFQIYLPATAQTSVDPETRSVRHEGRGTIIVVDDEEVIRTTLGRMLQSLGYAVVCRSDGSDAVDFYVSETNGQRQIAALIFDLTIPGGMSGVQAATEVRKLNKDVPIFVVSGYADDPVMSNPAEYGFTASMSKPFTISELSEMLNANIKN
jgi:two-component system, cell cycle sensor histidine kinase and response regulator CckA